MSKIRFLAAYVLLELRRGERTSTCCCCDCSTKHLAILPLLLESFHETFFGSFFFSLLHFCSDRRNDSFHYPFRLSFTSSSIYSLWLFHVALCFVASLIMSVLS